MGNVYPHINITELEEPQFVNFDVTENTVLVPMLCARSFEDGGTGYIDVNPRPKLYTSSKEFIRDMSTGAGKIKKENGDIVGNSPKYVFYNDGMVDRSYVMVCELLNSGLNVVVCPITFDDGQPERHYSDNKFHMEISEYQEILEESLNTGFGALDEFIDRNIYNIKFITSGAYPNKGQVYCWEGLDPSEGGMKVIKTSGIAGYLVDIASKRGDCIALVELSNDFVIDCTSLINSRTSVSNNYKFSCCTAPWCSFNLPITVAEDGNYTSYESLYIMPGSFAYLMAYAESIKTNANWFSAGGTSRGYIPKMVEPLFEIGDSVKDILQGMGDSDRLSRINPIMNAGVYGYRIWGNKVLYPVSTSVQKMLYQDFLNVRILMCDIKKQIYHAAMRVTFEPNDDIVWLNFKSLANTLLDKMKSGRGIKWYKWFKEEADDKATIKATLKIQPIEAVEAFDITVLLTDNEAEALEEEVTTLTV